MKFSKKLLNQCQEFVKSNLSEWRMLDADSSVMLVTSLIVGIGSGLGAVLFRRLIEWFQSLAYRDISGLLTEWYPLHLILIPALGGAIVGPLVYYFAREAKGHGAKRLIEGTLTAGARVAVIDDTCSTGGSLVHAIDAMEAAGCEVVVVACILDRQTGGSDAIRERGHEFVALLQADADGNITQGK